MAEEAVAPLPSNLAATPALDRWIRVDASGLVTLFPGKIELGQGILTALSQIAADELDVPLDMVRVAPASTATSPDEGVTSGSLSISTSGMAIRQVAAEVRALFRAGAAQRFGVAEEELDVQNGIWRGPGNRTASYAELAAFVSLDVTAKGRARPKPPGARSVAGTAARRVDIHGRVFGTRPYIHDLVPSGLLHGRVLRRPPGATLVKVDRDRFAQRHPHARLVQDGAFLGVIAATEHSAGAALSTLDAAVAWREAPVASDPPDPAFPARDTAAETSLVAQRGDAHAPDGRRIARSYLKPALAHASIGPSCAIARWEGSRLTVWSHTQGVFNLRADLAVVFDIPPADITVNHAEGAGCYGHNGADDAALDAALLARATPGAPVRVLWSRADELTASPFGAPMRMDLAATLSSAGDIVDWRHDLWSSGHTARPGRASTPALLASYDIAHAFPPLAASDPPLSSGGGSDRNAVPGYDFPRWTITKHQLRHAHLRTSSMRSLGAFGNVFAIESFMDELAELAGSDPLAFRLRHTSDPRARHVLRNAFAMAGELTAAEGVGRGLAYARYKNTGGYCAVVAEVDLERDPRATRLWIAADVGETINPDGVVNQIEGGAIQAVSWALKEGVGFGDRQPDCGSWDRYPILRFSEAPVVVVNLVARPEAPPLGAGEIAQGPTAAALANAIGAALGVRVRQMPLTREQILAAME